MTIKEGIKRILLWLKKISNKIDGSGSGSYGRYFPITDPLQYSELVLDREIPDIGSIYRIDAVDVVDENNLFLAKDRYSRLFCFTNFCHSNIDDVIEDMVEENNILIMDSDSNTTCYGGLFIDEDNKLKLFTEHTNSPSGYYLIQYTPKLYIKK